MIYNKNYKIYPRPNSNEVSYTRNYKLEKKEISMFEFKLQKKVNLKKKI